MIPLNYNRKDINDYPIMCQEETPEETLEEKNQRIYAQQFLSLADNPDFIYKVKDSIGQNIEKPQKIVDDICQMLHAQIFQHFIDISIAARLAMKHLIQKQTITCFDENCSEISNLDQEYFRDLIVENKGWIRINF